MKKADKQYGLLASALSVLVVCLICFFPACNEEDAGLIFPHQFHTDPDGDVGASCTDCHSTDANGQKMKLPTHEECSQCHSIDVRIEHHGILHSKEHEKYEQCDKCHKEQVSEVSDECVMCHTRDDRKVFIKLISLAPDDLIFSHQKHLDLNYECLKCHPDIIKREKVSFSDIPKMDKCFECHNVKDTNCNKCHSEIRETRRPFDHTIPISHDASWKVRHGRELKGNEDKCELCHKADNCQECHLKNKPSSHTLSWKQDIHGRYATRDRENCAVCHQADYCSRCHQQKPTTHFEPNWVPNHRVPAKRNGRSCLVCHERDFCGICHNVNLKKIVK